MAQTFLGFFGCKVASKTSKHYLADLQGVKVGSVQNQAYFGIRFAFRFIIIVLQFLLNLILITLTLLLCKRMRMSGAYRVERPQDFEREVNARSGKVVC